MNTLIPFALLSALFIATNLQASEHHSGHAGMTGGGSSASHCVKAHVTKFKPEHLATVKPESEFSFIAFNIYKPELINVTVKNQPVDIDFEFKDPFYLVKAKLPENLKNTAARINIKITGKAPSCDAEGGWLLKIE